MATRRTTKTGLIVDAENHPPRRVTKLGLIVEFTALVVVTNPATNVQITTATINGEVEDDGGYDLEARFRWREQGAATWNETSWQNTLETGDTYHEELAGLDADTTYEFQTQGRSAHGTGSWTASETFTTYSEDYYFLTAEDLSAGDPYFTAPYLTAPQAVQLSQVMPVVEAEDPYRWALSQSVPTVEAHAYHWWLAQSMPAFEATPYFAHLSQVMPVIEAFAVFEPSNCTCEWDEDTDCIRVEWTNNAPPGSTTIVERRIGTAAWQQITTLPSTIEYLEDCTVVRGFAYQYRVASDTSGVTSDYCTTQVCRAGTTQIWDDPNLEGKYSVVVRDTSGTQLTIADAYERLEYVRKLNEPGYYEIRGLTDTLDPDDFDLDYLVSIMRKAPHSSWEEDYTGLHRHTRIHFDQQDREIFHSVGPGLLDLIKRRIIKPPVGKTFFAPEGPFTDVMRESVRAQASTGAEADRQLPGLEVESDTGEGITLAPQNLRYDNLYDYVKLASGAGEGADFDIERTDEANFKFKVYYPQRGLDCRVHNPEGNAPVVFSLKRGNMSMPDMKNNRLNEVTYAYVAGEGVGAQREIVERSSLIEAEDDSPWNRVETFLEASSQTSTSALMQIGDTYLHENKQDVTFTCEAEPTQNCLYQVHWDLGYLVTGYYRDIQYDMQITEIHITVDQNGEHIEPTFKVLDWNPVEEYEGYLT